MSERATRLVGLYAVVAGVAAVVISPLLAMSYFGIEDGADELDSATVSAWADPGRDIADGLLTFASADRVYATYIQIFSLLMPALFLCAWTVRRRRTGTEGRIERWAWPLALVGYACLGLGGLVVAFLLIGASPNGNVVNAPFLALIIPGILLGTIGSTVLGIALIRAGYRPTVAPWLLAFSFVLWITGSDLLGHNSVGLTPMLVAWGASGWRLLRLEAVG
jgi:hypothetical protein